MTTAREMATRFVDEVVRPGLDDWDEAARYPRDAVAESGLTGLFVSKDKGGLELSYPEAVGVFEALGRGDGSLAFSMSMHNAVAAAINGVAQGSVLERWGGALTQGEALGCFSLTEPHAGSDATAITSRATLVGDRWRLSGEKAWVTLGAEADVYAVVAKTSGEPGHRDIAMFVMAADAPGIEFTDPYRKAASDFLPITGMRMRDVPVDLLVPPGAGMKAALGAIDVARFDIAAISNGLHAEALAVAVRYAQQRQTMGVPIIEHQGLGWMLADVATELEAARGLTMAAAHALGTDRGPVAIAHAKRFGPDAALRAAITCSEALGAYGWLRDHPYARLNAVAKMLTVVDGSAEIQRIVVARDLARSTLN